MAETTVVNLRDKPARPYCRIDRVTIYGNPFVIGPDGDREQVLRSYAVYFEDRIQRDARFRAAVLALKGKRLACWCAPEMCHGDIIVEWLQQQS